MAAIPPCRCQGGDGPGPRPPVTLDEESAEWLRVLRDADPDDAAAPADWDQLAETSGIPPADQVESKELVDALRRAVDTCLTERQRQVFVAIIVQGIPLDTLVAERGTNRNAIYKMMFDARRKLRGELVAQGYLDRDPPEAA